MEYTLVPCFFAVFVVFLDIAGHPATASVGEPISFKSSDTGPANFSFSLPPYAKDIPITVIANPSGGEVFNVDDKNIYNITTSYKGRIDHFQFRDWKISFSLKNVTADDAGNYSCREGSTGGNVIADCGQILHYSDDKENGRGEAATTPVDETTTGATTDEANTGHLVESHSANYGPAILAGVSAAVGMVIAVIYCLAVETMRGGVLINNKKAHERQETLETVLIRRRRGPPYASPS